MAIFKPGELVVLSLAAVLSGLLHARFSLASWQLLARRLYLPAESSDATGQKQKKRSSGTPVSTVRRRGKGTSEGSEIDLHGAETLYVIPLTLDRISSLPLYHLLDNLCFAATVAIVIFAACGIAEQMFQVLYLAPLVILVSSVLFVFYALFKVELLPPFNSAANKGYAIAAGCFGFIVAIAMFALESPPRAMLGLNAPMEGEKESSPAAMGNMTATADYSVFVWSPADVAMAFSDLLDHIAQRANPSAAVPSLAGTHIESTTTGFKLLFCIIAGLISALLLAPAMRFSRAFRLTQEPPDWAGDQIKRSFVATSLLAMHMILPLLLFLVWIRPFSESILSPLAAIQGRLDEEESHLHGRTMSLTEMKSMARGVLVLITGFVMIGNLRVLAQRYLDATMVAWHSIKHSVRRSSSERSQAAALIRAKATAVQLMLGKAAIQNTATALVFVTCGLILVACDMPIPSSSSLAVVQAPNLLRSVVLVRKILAGIAGFTVWWSAFVWMVYCGFGLWLLRTGTITT